mmetsp:Transcript_45782/g.128819  ORF Transcript_45782/g.128819 Transcript_45782/m.128819 type:complete len:241 (+) Transcript_45782:1407-2129(+)
MRGDKGGGARGVDGHARALQVEGVGEAVGGDGVRSRGCAASAAQVDHARRAHAHPIVLVDADEVADVLRLPLQATLVPTALEQGHVGNLHDLPLARVHALGLGRRDLEEPAIEEVHALDAEATVPRVGAAEVRVRVEVRTVVPPHEGDLGEAVRRRLADAGPSLPAAVRCGAIPAVHARDGDVLASRRRRACPEARQLRVADHVLQHVARRLTEEEGRQSQRRAHRRLVAVIEAAAHDQH